jgi:hypothetical protein
MKISGDHAPCKTILPHQTRACLHRRCARAISGQACKTQNHTAGSPRIIASILAAHDSQLCNAARGTASGRGRWQSHNKDECPIWNSYEGRSQSKQKQAEEHKRRRQASVPLRDTNQSGSRSPIWDPQLIHAGDGRPAHQNAWSDAAPWFRPPPGCVARSHRPQTPGPKMNMPR